MQFKRIRLPFISEIRIENDLLSIVSKENIESVECDEAINQLLQDGWQIKSTSPIVCSTLKNGQVFTYTNGIEIFLVNTIKDDLKDEIENVSFEDISKFQNPPLKPGKFQFPTDCLNDEEKIKFLEYWRTKWDWNGQDNVQELDSSGAAIRTYLLSLGLISNSQNSNNYFENKFSSRMIYVHDKIKKAHDCIEIDNEDSREKLFDAFNAIQLWGGKMGKAFYYSNTDTSIASRITQGVIIKNKWNDVIDQKYRLIVKSIINRSYHLKEIKAQFDEIAGLGVAFATKHINFWSEEYGEKDLPIYDSFIYQIIFAKENGVPQWRHYNRYKESLKDLKKLFKDGRFKITDIERALFAYGKKIGLNNSIPKDFETSETTIVVSFMNRRLKIDD